MIHLLVFKLLVAEFDLEKEKSLLDEQGLRIAENQENSQKNRRKLAESTRGTFLFHLLYCLTLQHFLLRDLDRFQRRDVNIFFGLSW